MPYNIDQHHGACRIVEVRDTDEMLSSTWTEFKFCLIFIGVRFVFDKLGKVLKGHQKSVNAVDRNYFYSN